MSASSQSRGEHHSPRGINYVKVAKAVKIVNRHCQVGDVIMIEAGSRNIMPQTDGLTEDHADYLMRLGIVRLHQLQPGDKPISVRPIAPKQYESEDRIESAQLRGQANAEKAVTGRQKAGGAV
jgi:hypothetical protein